MEPHKIPTVSIISQPKTYLKTLVQPNGKSWVEENRLKIRKKFIQRHEQNIEKERKAGVFKGM